MVHNSGINRLLNLLQTDLNYAAVGTGTAPIASANQLTTELLRKPTTSAIDGTTLIEELFFDVDEANTTITEIGVLGNSATASAGTGTLFASGAAAITKDNTQSLTISFEIELKEVF